MSKARELIERVIGEGEGLKPRAPSEDDEYIWDELPDWMWDGLGGDLIAGYWESGKDVSVQVGLYSVWIPKIKSKKEAEKKIKQVYDIAKKYDLDTEEGCDKAVGEVEKKVKGAEAI
jgi:hypothetical protein